MEDIERNLKEWTKLTKKRAFHQTIVMLARDYFNDVSALPEQCGVVTGESKLPIRIVRYSIYDRMQIHMHTCAAHVSTHAHMDVNASTDM